MKTLILLVVTSLVLSPLVSAGEGEKDPFPRIPLKLDDYGDDVIVLQRFLKMKEHLLLSGKWKMGRFGRYTESALKAYQERNKLPQTGVLDAPTKESILRDLGNKTEPPKKKKRIRPIPDDPYQNIAYAPPEVREVVFLI